MYSERGNETPALQVPIITALSIKIFAFDFQECLSEAEQLVTVSRLDSPRASHSPYKECAGSIIRGDHLSSK